MDDRIKYAIHTISDRYYSSIVDILSKTMSQRFMPEMKKELEEILEGNHLGLAALSSDDSVVGYITLCRTVETYKIETLAVDPMHQGMQVGKALVSAVENRIFEKEIKKLSQDQRWPIVINVVTDGASNNPVVQFYLKCGYSVMGIIPNEFSYGDKTFHLSKLIYKR